MIFMSVGTQKFPLDRLLQKMDEMIENDLIHEDVFAQIGNSTYEPKHFKYKRFIDTTEFEKAMQNCSLLITHGGVGTIIKGLSFGKPVIVVPRLAEFGEHVDDHQTEIAIAFERMNYVLCCGKHEDLNEFVKRAKSHSFEKYVAGNHNMINTIRDYLNSI